MRPEDGNVGTGNGKFGQNPQSPGSGATGGVLVAMGVVGIPAMSSPGRGATGGVLVAMGVVGMPEISGQVGMQPAQVWSAVWFPMLPALVVESAIKHLSIFLIYICEKK